MLQTQSHASNLITEIRANPKAMNDSADQKSSPLASAPPEFLPGATPNPQALTFASSCSVAFRPAASNCQRRAN